MTISTSLRIGIISASLARAAFAHAEDPPEDTSPTTSSGEPTTTTTIPTTTITTTTTTTKTTTTVAPTPPTAPPTLPPSTTSAKESESPTSTVDKKTPSAVTEFVRALENERVPENPAIDLLGADDLSVTRPGSVKDLAADLRTLYVDGKIVPQIAIEFSPWGLTFGRYQTYQEYAKGRAIDRILQRFTVSLATTSAGDDEDPLVLGAVGARLRLIDDSDWRLDAKKVGCALDAVKPGTPTRGNEGIGDVPQQTEDVNTAVNKCFAGTRWNARQLAIGGAISSAFPGGTLQWDINDVAGWLSYAGGYGDSTRLSLGGKYLFNDVQPVDGMLQRARHTVAASLEIEHRTDQYGLIGSLGIGARMTEQPMTDDWDTKGIGLVGAELQWLIAKDTWASIQFSAELEWGDGDKLISLANLKWNYGVQDEAK